MPEKSLTLPRERHPRPVSRALAVAPLRVWAAGERPAPAAEALARLLPSDAGFRTLGPVPDAPANAPAHTVLLADSAVFYTHEAFAAPPWTHPDGPAAQVLAELATDGFLHGALRERGGAYDGRMTHDPHGAFVFASYRDPRLTGTFDDYRATVAALCRGTLPEHAFDGAVRTAMRKNNAPLQPEELAEEMLSMQRNGWTQEDLVRFQQGLLAVTCEDVARVAREWLLDRPSSRVAVAGRDRQEEAEAFNLEPVYLTPTAGRRRRAAP